jgi:signal transduction histidine kinase
VQEDLTNALKHANAANVSVFLRYSPGALDIEVVDDGSGNGNGAGSGHGLVGMRQRAEVFGGWLVTAGLPGGGFAVRAHLPIGTS